MHHLALLFIVMNFGSVLFNHNEDNKKIIRNIESLNKKIINAKLSVLFNKTCISNNLLPSYTNIHLNREAVKRRKFTLEFREHLVRNEIQEKLTLINDLEEKLITEKARYNRLSVPEDLRHDTDSALEEVLTLHKQVGESKIQKKLCNLYNGYVPLPETKEGFVNLSKFEPTSEQKELLNLGLNYHYSPKFSQEEKKAELETLYQDICKLKSDDKILVNPDIQPQLQAEATRNRGHQKKSSLPAHLWKASRELRENEDIVIRRADKSHLFVILDRRDYLKKAQDILNDTKKFRKISRNPVDELKKQANSLITAANSHSGTQTLTKIVGEYKPGYFYGTVKTHKENNPLRPIISQIPLPTYTLAKTLNEMLNPYVPQKYSLRSSSEFIDLLKTSKREGIIASLDVTNLFTNVPVERTIDILLEYAYHNSTLAPPAFPSHIMAALLRLCTTKAPFKSPTGQLYYQVDGIAMGSPLGVLFAQAFMASVEASVIESLPCKPSLYCRFVDDILLDVQDLDSLKHLKDKLEEASGLRFTTELSNNNRINFLDVSIDATSSEFSTTVHRKPTDAGRCLSGTSLCPDRYKVSVVRAYVHRALKHCSTWELFNRELRHLKQLLSNNGYPISMIDSVANQTISAYIQRQENPDNPTPEHPGTTHVLYFKNQMSPAYKDDEKALKTIIRRNIKTRKPEDQVKLVVYYKNPTTKSLVLRNNMSEDPSILKKCNIVYRYNCKKGDCALQNSSYIGHTTTSLSRRITMHLQQGAIKTHNTTHHHEDRLTRADITDNISILQQESNRRKLHILEAVYIRKYEPAINRQVNARGILQLYEGAPL